MKTGILIIVLCLSACAWTPKDEAWKTSLETPRPKGVNGNCLPVAKKLQQKYGGNIAVISHPKKTPNTAHAVLMVEGGWMLDNGTVGYQIHWSDLKEDGWLIEYWMD